MTDLAPRRSFLPVLLGGLVTTVLALLGVCVLSDEQVAYATDYSAGT